MGFFSLQHRDKLTSPDPATQSQGLIDELDNLSTQVSGWAEVQHKSDGTHTFIAQGFDLVPVGVIVTWHAGIAVPIRWLLCNGATISRNTYALLFKQIGILYGAGDGVNTFALPTVANSMILAG